MKTITVTFELTKHKEVLSTFLSIAAPIFQTETILYFKVSCFTSLISEVPSLRQTELGISCSTYLRDSSHRKYKDSSQRFGLSCECSAVQHISHQSSRSQGNRKHIMYSWVPMLHYLQLGTEQRSHKAP